MSKFTEKDITPAVKSAVNAYLLAKCNADLHRERVDKIQRKILETTSYFTSDEFNRRGMERERITDPKMTFLLDEKESHDYFLDVKAELIKAGYEIESLPNEPEWSYYCPALTAESLQTDTEHILIESTAEMLGIDSEGFVHKLLCLGMEKYHAFIDLAVEIVVNAPGFKNPLTNQEV